MSLTTIRPEDYEFVQELFADPSNRRQAGVSLPLSRDDVAEFVEDTSDVVQFLVCREGEPVGHVVLSEIDTQARTAELGWYAIAAEERGNGYATEAADLCLSHAFDDRGLHKVWAQVIASNDPSIRVLEKLGFQREGVLREQEFANAAHVDVYRYGLLAAER